MKTELMLIAASLSLSLLSNAEAAEQALHLTPAVAIEIPDSKGKFDFLRIDSKRNRLLAAHENDGTSDFVDLKKNTLIIRLKVGGPTAATARNVTVDPQTRAVWTTYTDGKSSFVKSWLPPQP